MGHTEAGRFDHIHGDEDLLDVELSEDDLELARDDLIDQTLAGKKVGGLTTAMVLECEQNDNVRFFNDLAAICEMVESAPSSEISGAVRKYIRDRIAKRLKQEDIEDRAFNNRRGL